MKKTKLNKILIVSVITLAVALVSCVSVSFAKYIGNIIDEMSQKSSNFFFTSDLLSETGETYNLVGRNAFEIEIQNFSNSLSFTEKDVKFTLTVTGANVSGGSPVGSVYTINGGDSNYLSLTITPTADNVSISATSSAPYQKTISANFNVVDYYSTYNVSAVTATSTYLTVTLNIKQHIPSITINWDTTLYAHDNTNSLLESATLNGTIGSKTLTGLQSNTTYTLDFFLISSVTRNAISDTNISAGGLNLTI